MATNLLDRAIEIEERVGKPRLQQIPVSKLGTIARFQRNIDLIRAQRMAASFRPDAVGVLYVSKRTDGSMVVIDGQHRVAALRIASPRASDPTIACYVYTGLTEPEEADLYLLFNGSRVKPTLHELYVAALEKGEAEALTIAACVREVGLTVAPKSADGTIQAVGALRRIVRLGGAEQLRLVLGILHDAYRDQGRAYTGPMLLGLDAFLARYQEEYSRARLVAQLKAVEPIKLTSEANLYAGPLRGSAVTGHARAMYEHYSQGLRSGFLTDWSDAALQRKLKQRRHVGYDQSIAVKLGLRARRERS